MIVILGPLIYGLIHVNPTIKYIRAFTITEKIEWNKECYRFLRTPEDTLGSHLRPNTFKITPKDLPEYIYCGVNFDFQNSLNDFNYKNYGFVNKENLFNGKEAIDDLCYTFYKEMTPLNQILELDCTKQYINAFKKGHLTIKDETDENNKKRTQILNDRIKEKKDMKIIEKINSKFRKE